MCRLLSLWKGARLGSRPSGFSVKRIIPRFNKIWPSMARVYDEPHRQDLYVRMIMQVNGLSENRSHRSPWNRMNVSIKPNEKSVEKLFDKNMQLKRATFGANIIDRQPEHFSLCLRPVVWNPFPAAELNNMLNYPPSLLSLLFGPKLNFDKKIIYILCRFCSVVLYTKNSNSSIT